MSLSPFSQQHKGGQSNASLLSTGSNPFRDPSVELPRHTLSAHSSRDTYASSSAAGLSSRDASPARSPSPPVTRPGFNSRPSEIQRQLNLAIEDDLDLRSESDREGSREREAPIRRAHEKPKKESNSFMSQFRKGTGWFAPVVEPELPPTKEQADAANAERIRKIKESGGAGASKTKRPGFIKRMSSGVEMLGFGEGGKKPSMGARGRGQSLSEGVATD